MSNESNFWKRVRKNLPKDCYAFRIESRLANGIPDTHLIWNGLPFWLELKTTKNNSIRISPNQIAWNTAYFSKGGLCFYLVNDARHKSIYLFGGDQGSSLMDHGLRTNSLYQGSSFEDMFATLRLCDSIK
tara:strand:+ start:509 stop:898 length:390 start_codon:yes stop_codon:yes gene_type:complete